MPELRMPFLFVPFAAALVGVIMFFNSLWEGNRFEREVLLARDAFKACLAFKNPPSESICSQARLVLFYGPDIPHEAIGRLETCDARAVDPSPMSDPFAKRCDDARRTISELMLRAASVVQVDATERGEAVEKPLGWRLVAINVAVTLVTLLISLGLAGLARRKRAAA